MYFPNKNIAEALIVKIEYYFYKLPKIRAAYKSGCKNGNLSNSNSC